MRFILLTVLALLWTSGNSAQAQQYQNSGYGGQYSTEDIKKMRGSLNNRGDQVIARNILIVGAVANYKSKDEKLAKEFDGLQYNREYHEKLQKIMSQLNNSKMRNSKNREVISILNEAGAKIYNLLAN